MGRVWFGQLPAAVVSRRLVILMLAAFWLRMYQIDAFGFWIDEALTPLRAGYPIADVLSGIITIQDAASQDTHPPLYYLLIHLLQPLVGSSDLALRWPSALLGTLLVPLIYRLGQRLAGRETGFLAALFTAVNPLQIWYGQEARMYPLLMVTTTATLFFLWPLVERRTWRHAALLPYLLFAALSLATHYAAAFWLAGHALLFAWILWPSRQGKWLVGGGIAAGVAALASTPWTMPRLFTGAEAGYAYLPPWVMLSDLFTGFGLGVTPAGPNWWIDTLWVGLIIATFSALWLLYRADHPRLLGFFIINLLSVIVVIALISPLKPLYQGIRHIMIAFPPWIVLLALGTVFAAARLRHRRLLTANLVVWGAVLAFPLLLVGAAGGYGRLRTDPAVAKDHFREAIAYVEANAAPGDLILYNDAISMQLHHHYGTRDDLTVTALPTYPHRATDDMGNTLTQLLPPFDRVWFFNSPPNDGRDDDRIVPAWLDANLPLLNVKPFFSRGTILQVALYDSRSTAAPASTAAWSVTGWPELTGYSVLEIGPRHLFVELFWETWFFTPANEIELALIDETGQRWTAVQQPILPFNDPADPDPPRRQFRLPLPAGLPPGPYSLTARPMRDQHTPAGEPIVLETIIFSGMASAAPAEAIFGPLELVDVEIIADEIRPGYAVPIVPIWRTPSADFRPAELQFHMQVYDPTGKPIATIDKMPGPARPDLSAWPADMLIRDPVGIQLPPDTPPGRYELRWHVTSSDGQQMSRGDQLWPFAQDTFVKPFEVDAWPMITTLPPVDQPVDVRWGDFARLAGYSLNVDDRRLQVELVWESLQTTSENLFVFVHVIDPATGEIIAQQDWFPGSGLRYTTSWRPGEFVVDDHLLELEDAPAGRYVVNVGLVDPTSFVRPEVVADALSIPERQLTLEEITLP